jgi:outer membrane protein assembly factor BamA
VTTTPYLVRAETREHLYAVAVEVESGAQYRLGEIQFSGATIFSDAELREQFALQRNETFDVTKVREGMDSMLRLYDSKGFIDQVPEPDIFIDNEKRLVNILVKVVEGKQFRVRTAEIYGLDSGTEQLLKS